MKKYIFTIPDRNSNRFHCELYENCEYMYSKEVYLYNKDYSDERNVIILTEKMSHSLNLAKQNLIIPIRSAILLGESTLEL